MPSFPYIDSNLISSSVNFGFILLSFFVGLLVFIIFMKTTVASQSD